MTIDTRRTAVQELVSASREAVEYMRRHTGSLVLNTASDRIEKAIKRLETEGPI